MRTATPVAAPNAPAAAPNAPAAAPNAPAAAESTYIYCTLKNNSD